jgi:hypothetical protein
MQLTTSNAQSVTVRAWRFSLIVSKAVTMSAAVAHVMEMPAKMRCERDLYVQLHRRLYCTFGKVAGTAEAFAVGSAGLLALWGQKRRPRSSPLTMSAALSLAAAHGVYWAAVEPANRTMGGWRMDAIPPDWDRWRSRWEYGHAVRPFSRLVRWLL